MSHAADREELDEELTDDEEAEDEGLDGEEADDLAEGEDEWEEDGEEAEDEEDEEEEGDLEEADDPIADLLFEVVSRMGFQGVDIEWEEREDHVRYFIEGRELGALIGRHGSTLEALQYLVGVINSRRSLVEHKIIVDIEGYRERRESRLRRLAQRTASEAVREGQEIALEPMPSGDRRVIHLALSSNSSVSTYSEGEEPERCVIIAPRRERR